MLLDNGAGVNIVNANNNTALHSAAQEGHCGVITELLKNKANIHAKNIDGNAPCQ